MGSKYSVDEFSFAFLFLFLFLFPSADATRAVEEAVNLAQVAFNDEIVLVTATKKGDSEQAAELLDLMENHIADNAYGKTLRVTKHTVAGDAREVLVEQCRLLGADFLVVGSRGQSRLKATLLGSVSTYVLSHSPVGVICVKSDE